jgi:hypothetical protein
MQWYPIIYHGNDCQGTKNGMHHYEDSEDSLWCRQCGLHIDNMETICKIKAEAASDEIMSGRICPYCNQPTEYIDSSYIYKKSYGMIYICKPCNAYVGVHKGTSTALGRLANKELREAKKQAHHYFNKIYQTGIIVTILEKPLPQVKSRTAAYMWLSKEMGVDRKYCHIGMFDIEQCNKVIALCKKALGEK